LLDIGKLIKMKWWKYILVFTLGGGVILGVGAATIPTLTFTTTSLISNENIQGTESVGIIILNGDNLDLILNDFTIEKKNESCNEIEATTTPFPKDVCERVKVFYKEKIVRVYIILSKELAINDYFNKISDFPLDGQLYYEKSDENVEGRLIQMMEESGNKQYTIIYEQ